MNRMRPRALLVSALLALPALGASALAVLSVPLLTAPAGATTIAPLAGGPSTGLVATGVTPTGCRPAPAGQVTCFAQTRGPLPSSASSPTGSTGASSRAAALASPPPYQPADLSAMYGLAGWSSTRTVAIVDATSDPNIAALMALYRQDHGLPACGSGCFREVNQHGGSSLPATDPSWIVEIDLDVEAVSATCPTCHILLVDAADAQPQNMDAAVQTAVALGASVVSMSWGSTLADDPSSADDAAVYAHGPLYVAATGDSGYHGLSVSDCSTPSVPGSDHCANYPAAFPDVVAVGGTTVTSDGSGYHVAGWGDAGSGCTGSAAPTWQGPSLTGCAGRAVADVSALADPDPGLEVYVDNGDGTYSAVPVGGTSLATPIIAAMYALAGNSTLPQAPYLNAASTPGLLLDVTSGPATGSCSPASICTPGAGWDGPTGLGSPLSPALFAAAPGVGPSAPPSSSSPPSSPPSSAAPSPSSPAPVATRVVLTAHGLVHGRRGRVTVSVTGGSPVGTVVIYDGSRRVGVASVTAVRHAGISVLLTRLATGRHRLHVVFTPSDAGLTGSAATVTARVR